MACPGGMRNSRGSNPCHGRQWHMVKLATAKPAAQLAPQICGRDSEAPSPVVEGDLNDEL